MCAWGLSPVGASSEPAQMDIFDSPASSQNKLEPHSPQKPRLTVTAAAYHRSPRCSVSLKPSLSIAVYAPTCPCQRRHFEQWQNVTNVISLLTSKRTAPHAHPPVFIRIFYIAQVRNVARNFLKNSRRCTSEMRQRGWLMETRPC